MGRCVQSHPLLVSCSRLYDAVALLIVESHYWL
jgi:hypothetical protein